MSEPERVIILPAVSEREPATAEDIEEGARTYLVRGLAMAVFDKEVQLDHARGADLVAFMFPGDVEALTEYYSLSHGASAPASPPLFGDRKAA